VFRSTFLCFGTTGNGHCPRRPITSAIGAALAGWYGSNALLRNAERTSRAANPEDVRNGLIAYKIAAHAADIARHRPELVIAMMNSPAPLQL